MADSKVADLAAVTALDGDELLYVVDTPSGTPADRKVTAKVLSGMAVISETVLGSTAASVTFSSIPSTYRHLQVFASVRTDYVGASDRYDMRINGDTGTNYDGERFRSNNTTLDGLAVVAGTWAYIGTCPGAGATAAKATGSKIVIPDYAGTTMHKVVLSESGWVTGTTTSTIGLEYWSNVWRSTSAITSLSFFSENSANFVAGSVFTLYGMRGA